METTFTVSPQDEKKITTWLHEVVYPEIVAKQRQDKNIPSHLMFTSNAGVTYPYEGAIGGGLTYEFTPNSIGLHVCVTYPKYGKLKKDEDKYYKLDLTDYDSW